MSEARAAQSFVRLGQYSLFSANDKLSKASPKDQVHYIGNIILKKYSYSRTTFITVMVRAIESIIVDYVICKAIHSPLMTERGVRKINSYAGETVKVPRSVSHSGMSAKMENRINGSYFLPKWYAEYHHHPIISIQHGIRSSRLPCRANHVSYEQRS